MYADQIIVGLINIAMMALTFVVRASLRRLEEKHCQSQAKPPQEIKQKPLDKALCEERDYAD